MIVIKDGAGTSNKAEVTANNRLKTTGVDLTITEAATESGDTYNINSALIPLTSTNESALFYIKNNEENDLLVDQIIINFRDYVGTDGQPNLRIYRNPTGGSIVTNAECARSRDVPARSRRE